MKSTMTLVTMMVMIMMTSMRLLLLLLLPDEFSKMFCHAKSIVFLKMEIFALFGLVSATAELHLRHLGLHLGHLGARFFVPKSRPVSCPKLLNFGHETFEPHLTHLALILAILDHAFSCRKV